MKDGVKLASAGKVSPSSGFSFRWARDYLPSMLNQMHSAGLCMSGFVPDRSCGVGPAVGCGMIKMSWAVALTNSSVFIYSAAFFSLLIFFDRKWSYCWEKQVMMDFFFFILPQEGSEVEFPLWMLEKQQQILEWHFIVILYVWVKQSLSVWYVNLLYCDTVQA